MKKLIFGFLVLTLVGFVACKKNIIHTNSDTSKVSDSIVKSQTYTATYVELNYDQIEFVSNMHNEILECVYSNGNIKGNELHEKMLGCQVGNFSNNEKLYIIDNTVPHTIEYLENNINNDPIALEYCQLINSSILSSESINEITSLLTDISNEIKSDNREFNKTIPLLFSQVSLKSAAFWSGNKGIGITNEDPIEMLSPYITGIIAADGLGASGTFTGYGLLVGITGPVGFGALLAVVGWGAAWSSVCAL